MVNRLGKELRLVLAWLIFPVLPVVLEDLYSQVARGSVDSRGGGLDPHDWGWLTWVIMLGPLVGYGFLAGATMSVPDDDPSRRRGLRRLLARCAVWVAIGPWWGALACAACVFGLLWLGARPQMPQSWRSTWIEPVILWGIGILGVAICGYSWLWPAWSALAPGCAAASLATIAGARRDRGRRVRRLVVRQFLGRYRAVAKLLLRPPHRSCAARSARVSP